jgi:hypothetical protein
VAALVSSRNPSKTICAVVRGAGFMGHNAGACPVRLSASLISSSPEAERQLHRRPSAPVRCASRARWRSPVYSWPASPSWAVAAPGRGLAALPPRRRTTSKTPRASSSTDACASRASTCPATPGPGAGRHSSRRRRSPEVSGGDPGTVQEVPVAGVRERLGRPAPGVPGRRYDVRSVHAPARCRCPRSHRQRQRRTAGRRRSAGSERPRGQGGNNACRSKLPQNGPDGPDGPGGRGGSGGPGGAAQ